MSQFEEIKKLIKEKAEIQGDLKEKENALNTLKGQLNLLTEGKTPEEKAKEMIRSNIDLEEKKRLVNNLKKGILSLQDLEEKRAEREILWQRLVNLEKKWSLFGLGKRKKRKKLNDQIEAIGQEISELQTELKALKHSGQVEYLQIKT